jgi:hypothetical protein
VVARFVSALLDEAISSDEVTIEKGTNDCGRDWQTCGYDIQDVASVVRPSTTTLQPAACADTSRDSCRPQQHDIRNALYFKVLF